MHQTASGDRERSLGQVITNCVYTNNGFYLQSKIHAPQSDLYPMILSMSHEVDMIIVVIYTTFTVGKRKPEKNSGLYGIRTHDLCDTGVALYQLNCTGIAEVKGSNPVQPDFFYLGFLFATAKVASITAMIILHLIRHSAVHIIWFSYIQNFI